MKQLTNSQLSELREKYIFYCNAYTKEIYYAGLNPPKISIELHRENELVLKLIENAILTKKAEKRRKARLKMALWRK